MYQRSIVYTAMEDVDTNGLEYKAVGKKKQKRKASLDLSVR